MPYNNIRALIADDDDHVRAFFVVLFRRILEAPVLEARNGAEAVEIYRKERPDLVLLDVNMPHLDGMDALKQIREINPDAVITVITSLSTRRIVEQAVSLGAVSFIRKDTVKSEFLEIIKETIKEYLVPLTGATES